MKAAVLFQVPGMPAGMQLAVACCSPTAMGAPPPPANAGWACFRGLTPSCGSDCSGAPLLPVLYVLLNLAFNVSGGQGHRVLTAHCACAGGGGLTGAESREPALPGSCPAQAAPPGVTPCAESPAPAAASAAALELIRQAGNVAMSLTMSAIVPVTILAFTVGWAGLGLTAGASPAAPSHLPET